jgi:hypothetical protein
VTVELHPGGPRLSAATPLARRDAVLAGADAAAGVAALHDAGLLHGAVGPDAVVLAGGTRPVLVGAGTPLLAAAGREELPPTRTADDLHGLGVVLHQLLVGTPPADPPVPPVRNVPDLEPSLNGLILALLSRDPDRPPPPAGAVARRLRALATDAPRPPVVTTATRVADGIERGLAELAVYALFAALALVGVVAAYAATREEDAPPVATVTVSTPGLATLQPPPTVPLSTTPVATDPGPDEDGIVTETSVQTVGSVATVTATETVTSTETVTDVQTTTAPTTTTADAQALAAQGVPVPAGGRLARRRGRRRRRRRLGRPRRGSRRRGRGRVGRQRLHRAAHRRPGPCPCPCPCRVLVTGGRLRRRRGAARGGRRQRPPRPRRGERAPDDAPLRGGSRNAVGGSSLSASSM